MTAAVAAKAAQWPRCVIHPAAQAADQTPLPQGFGASPILLTQTCPAFRQSCTSRARTR